MHLIDQLPCGQQINTYFRTQFRLSDKQAMVVILETLTPPCLKGAAAQPPTHLCIANTHIYWDPTYPSIKLMQVFLLTQAIEQIVAGWQDHTSPLSGMLL